MFAIVQVSFFYGGLRTGMFRSNLAKCLTYNSRFNNKAFIYCRNRMVWP